VIGLFGLNFQIFIATMSVRVFHGGAHQYGLLNSAMAAGTLGGALLAASRHDPKFRLLAIGAGVFGLAGLASALAPNVWVFAAALAVGGVAILTFTSATSSLMQLSTEPAMRGRVLALRLAVGLGVTPLGAPAVGWVADRFGPRWSVAVGAASGLAAAAIALNHMRRNARAA
jgi:MFS family permease